MSRELLENTIRDELKKRISKVENKQFVLLYKASRDGCSVDAFQNKCLDKGPTLMVLYGQDRTVFGGYTSKPWKSTNDKVLTRDSEAFLFYRRLHESTHFLEMEERDFDRAITYYRGYGPTFGGGKFSAYDLQVFRNKNKIDQIDNIFELGGKTNFNCIYKSKETGFHKKSINDGGLIVTDIEVYKVEGSDFFTDTKQECETRISSFCSNKHVKTYNILLAGLISAGKTSYCRTLYIACTGKIQDTVGPIAQQGTSVTNKIGKYILPRKDTCQVRLLDIRGFEDKRGYENEFEDLLDGRLGDDFQFSGVPKNRKQSSLVLDDINPDRIVHTLCIVIDVTKFEIQTDHSLNHTSWICGEAHKKNLHVSVVATNMDKLCTFINEKPGNIKKSVRAQEMMEKISGTLGVELNCIFPVINYTNEEKTDELKNILALRALAKMVEKADAFVTNNIGRLKMQYIQTRLKKVECKGLNILCVGRVNVGKSFFIDSIMSTLMKSRMTPASGGLKRTETPFEPSTKQLRRHTLVITDQQRLSCGTNVHILDMPGFYGKNLIDSEQIKAIVEGHCPVEKFDLLNRIDENIDGYIQNPKWQDRVHVVCFILDGESIEHPTEEREMIEKVISETLNKKGIPYIVVVTKIDKLTSTRDNIIKKTADLFNLVSGKVHVIKNYVDENQSSANVDIPIIDCFEAIVEEGYAYYRTHSTNM